MSNKVQGPIREAATAAAVKYFATVEQDVVNAAGLKGVPNGSETIPRDV